MIRFAFVILALACAACGSASETTTALVDAAADPTPSPVVADCSGGNACRFITAWEGSMQSGTPPPGSPFAGNTGFSNQTVRQIVRPSVAGRALRIRLSNLFGDTSLVIGEVRVALDAGGGATNPSTEHPVTFAGAAQLTLAAGAEATSDDVAMTIPAGSKLAISLHLPGTTGPATFHNKAMTTTYIAQGNATHDVVMAGATTSQSWYYLSGVDVLADARTKVIVAFGDSITDGAGSTLDGNDRWTDALGARLAARQGRAYAVANAGIAGNGLLSEIIGPKAQARFARDVLERTGVTHVVLLEGINDLGYGYGYMKGPVTAEQMIAGYQSLIAAAHGRGLRIFGATLLPYHGATYYTPEGEDVRKAVNNWIRTSGSFDGVVDFEAVTTNSATPPEIAGKYDTGDHLHPNPAGYSAMAAAVPLTWFD